MDEYDEETGQQFGCIQSVIAHFLSAVQFVLVFEYEMAQRDCKLRKKVVS